MLINPLTFHSPSTVQEAASLIASLPEVRIMAGGTFLLNSLKLLKRKGAKTPQHVISLRKVEQLKGVTLAGDELIIRSMTIINDLFENPFLKDNFALLKTVCRNISTNPIRNMATVGGNLTCRYTWTEMGAAMIALQADLHFVDAQGQEEVIKAEDFFKAGAKTQKLLTHVSIKKDPTAFLAYRRVKKTIHVDQPLLAVCVKTHFKDNAFFNPLVSVNNGIAFAQRDHVLENFLNHQPSEIKIAQEALDHLDTNIYDTRSDDYKKHMFRVSLKNCLREIIEKKLGKTSSS